MESIWKFPLEITVEQAIYLPRGYTVLAVQMQNGRPCLWARVDPEAPQERMTFFTHGTGHRISPEAGEHVGTYQAYEGAVVFHVFAARSGE